MKIHHAHTSRSIVLSHRKRKIDRTISTYIRHETHGIFYTLPDLQTVYRAVIIAKLMYASSAWWGFTTAADMQRLESFLRRDRPTVAQLAEDADDTLFSSVTRSSNHLLHVLLPEHTNHPYNLRSSSRTHSFKLSAQHDDRNFINSMLFRQAYSVSVWLLSWLYFIHLTAVFVLFLLHAIVFFFLHIYLQLRFVICILYNKWKWNENVSISP